MLQKLNVNFPKYWMPLCAVIQGTAQNAGIIQRSVGEEVLTVGGCDQHTWALIK
jgi:hypothetical protein